MAWVETQSRSFTARHDSREAEGAADLLERLEEFRERVVERFPAAPAGVAVVVHPGLWQLGLAHPWLPLARLAAAPASRRYFAGWFAAGEIHVLSGAALEERASRVPGSREALERAPLHEYAHLAIAAGNPALPPPFGPRGFSRYLRWAWLIEGAATWLAGQVPHLRAAVARRLREGRKPAFPPSARDALVLGGSVYALLEQTAGPGACVALTSALDGRGPRPAIERAFELPFLEVEARWRDHLAAHAAGQEPRRRRARS
jgi:hypothetical protein